MEIAPQRKVSSDDVGVASTLPVYRSPPELEIRLEDFELFAIDRLRGYSLFISTYSSLLRR